MKSKQNAIGTTGKGIVYEEKAPFSKTMKLLIVLIFSILALSVVSAFFGSYFFFGIRKEPFEGQLIMIFVVILVIFAFWSFLKMKFRITQTSVDAFMQPFTYSIPFSEIK